jgi:hypothetical protein
MATLGIKTGPSTMKKRKYESLCQTLYWLNLIRLPESNTAKETEIALLFAALNIENSLTFVAHLLTDETL